ncbi:hypothetical protein [Labrenzia sp. DG1229]|uniref:hypothetical protein n=1 Tax=Labrenzia sp. DG1229 TaxID=681847 RepID=UPI0012EC6232|nr:hypothetical protein [Labrenzia sp. DG1229]
MKTREDHIAARSGQTLLPVNCLTTLVLIHFKAVAIENHSDPDIRVQEGPFLRSAPGYNPDNVEPGNSAQAETF